MGSSRIFEGRIAGTSERGIEKRLVLLAKEARGRSSHSTSSLAMKLRERPLRMTA